MAGTHDRRNVARVPWPAVAAMAALVVVPIVLAPFWVNLANLILIAAVGAVAFNVLLGVAGQLSLGHAAFMAIGGFLAAALSGEVVAVPFPVVVLLGALACALAASVVGAIALRIRGLYLVLATIALHFVVLYGLLHFQRSRVGTGAFLLDPPSLIGFSLSSPLRWYYLLVIVLLVVIAFFRSVLRSRSGRAWRALRQSDIAAELLGVDIAREKVVVFMITSAVIGAQGVLFAHYITVVTVETYTLDLAIAYAAMIVIGGLGSIGGALVGAAFVTSMPYVVRGIVDRLSDGVPAVGRLLGDHIFDFQSMLYGALIVGFLLFEPRGIVAIARRWEGRLRRGGTGGPGPDGMAEPDERGTPPRPRPAGLGQEHS